MTLMLPLHSHKFMVLPLGREDFAEAFMQNVASAEIDLANRVFRVQVRQSRDTITLSAVNYAVRNQWIPELHLDVGSNTFSDGKLIRFLFEPQVGDKSRAPVTHSLRFDYANGDVALHHIEWAFTEFVMERIETPEGASASRATRSPAYDEATILTPEQAVAAMEAEPKP